MRLLESHLSELSFGNDIGNDTGLSKTLVPLEYFISKFPHFSHFTPIILPKYIIGEEYYIGERHTVAHFIIGCCFNLNINSYALVVSWWAQRCYIPYDGCICCCKYYKR